MWPDYVRILARLMGRSSSKNLEYIARTPDRRLRFVVYLDNEIVLAYADADYAAGLDNKCSVSGAFVILGGAAGCMVFKAVESAALSTTEAGYVALTEVAKGRVPSPSPEFAAAKLDGLLYCCSGGQRRSYSHGQ